MDTAAKMKTDENCGGNGECDDYASFISQHHRENDNDTDAFESVENDDSEDARQPPPSPSQLSPALTLPFKRKFPNLDMTSYLGRDYIDLKIREALQNGREHAEARARRMQTGHESLEESEEKPDLMELFYRDTKDLKPPFDELLKWGEKNRYRDILPNMVPRPVGDGDWPSLVAASALPQGGDEDNSCRNEGGGQRLQGLVLRHRLVLSESQPSSDKGNDGKFIEEIEDNSFSSNEHMENAGPQSICWVEKLEEDENGAKKRSDCRAWPSPSTEDIAMLEDLRARWSLEDEDGPDQAQSVEVVLRTLQS